ncbi:extensin-like domain-containing protein [Pseudotabrizicola algicola]|uniref:Extensin family protein n=1 Tax=Pseudotabrizicola algicola TaxID=2709381 RepID=A0A6B3RN47_9RHOB|nr:extensin family protein [Pseudotabrizicola algicola]NEX47524.1 extensin family protein [Pseudotabrizicola algicola]
MLRGVVTGAVFWALAGAALADAPSSSPRPMPRPGMVAIADPQVLGLTAEVAGLPGLARSLRPVPRPVTVAALAPAPVAAASAPAQAAPAAAAQVVMATASAPVPVEKKGLFGMLRPNKRPGDLVDKQLVSATLAPVAPGKQGVVSRKGAVCGDPSIMGEALAPITSRVKGCGVPDPVRITSVAGVRLSQAATVDCDTARALKTWVERGLEPAYGKGKVVQLQVAGSYVCRTQNHRSGARLSEHARGRAIDISGFTFSNGKTVSVLRNFDKTMRKAHKAACGIFKTTLGPGSDGMHEDHLHFDVAQRGSTYCR